MLTQRTILAFSCIYILTKWHCIDPAPHIMCTVPIDLIQTRQLITNSDSRCHLGIASKFKVL